MFFDMTVYFPHFAFNLNIFTMNKNEFNLIDNSYSRCNKDEDVTIFDDVGFDMLCSLGELDYPSLVGDTNFDEWTNPSTPKYRNVVRFSYSIPRDENGLIRKYSSTIGKTSTFDVIRDYYLEFDLKIMTRNEIYMIRLLDSMTDVVHSGKYIADLMLKYDNESELHGSNGDSILSEIYSLRVDSSDIHERGLSASLEYNIFNLSMEDLCILPHQIHKEKIKAVSSVRTSKRIIKPPFNPGYFYHLDSGYYKHYMRSTKFKRTDTPLKIKLKAEITHIELFDDTYLIKFNSSSLVYEGLMYSLEKYTEAWCYPQTHPASERNFSFDYLHCKCKTSNMRIKELETLPLPVYIMVSVGIGLMYSSKGLPEIFLFFPDIRVEYISKRTVN